MKKLFISLFLIIALSVTPVYAGSQQTSSTLASAIITNARYYLAEPTPKTWDNDELLVWLNNGTLDIASRTRCLEGTEDVTLTANTIEYAISGNYIDLQTAIYVDTSSPAVSKGLVRKNPQSIGHITDVGEPVYWYEWAGKIGVYPALSTATTEKVTVYFVSRPAAVTSADAVLVPAIYDKALTLYIAGEAFKKIGQFAKAGRFMAEYLAELDRFRADFVARPPEPEENIR